MYIVVSKWEVVPGHEDVIEEKGTRMVEIVTGWPEVEFFHNLRTEDGGVLAIIGYRSEGDYHRLFEPNGRFETAAKETGIENDATWKWSERGEPMNSPALR